MEPRQMRSTVDDLGIFERAAGWPTGPTVFERGLHLLHSLTAGRRWRVGDYGATAVRFSLPACV